MTRLRIERFLKILAAQIDGPARAYLTGAAAAAVWGRVRPSVDIDLGLEWRTATRRHSPGSWEALQRAVDRTTRLTGIPTSVAEDIDRWGMITLLDYKRSSTRFAVFGRLEVRLLNPANWSIGKLTRCLDPDLRDVVEVFRRQDVSWLHVVRTWGKALRVSPASTAQFQFRGNVEDFLRRRGRSAWGPAFDAATATRRFHTAAGIPAA
ncbi:MAG: hypothetical protein ABUS79_04580 [Pseudomonadota bacterium]